MKKTIPLTWKKSKAHEWVQSLPLADKTLECVRCGAKTKIGKWKIKKCKTHYVDIKSGW